MRKFGLSLIFISVSVFISSLIFISDLKAATFLVNGDKNPVGLNSTLDVKVNVDTQKENLNAFAGTLQFPNNLLSLQEIKTGSSIINLFIDEPKEAQPGKISFSGITPGGFTGQGFLIEAIFKTKIDGKGKIIFTNSRAFINDGSGNVANATASDFNFIISSTTPATDDTSLLTDKEEPETFTPIITKIPDIGGNNYLLVFNTQDKISGIDHYEVKEGNGIFKIATSPYQLEDQSLKHDIIVKAIDKSKNERLALVKLEPNKINPTPASYGSLLVIIIVIIILVLAAILLAIFGWRHKKNKHNKK